jgi:hypothetical protein
MRRPAAGADVPTLENCPATTSGGMRERGWTLHTFGGVPPLSLRRPSSSDTPRTHLGAPHTWVSLLSTARIGTPCAPAQHQGNAPCFFLPTPLRTPSPLRTLRDVQSLGTFFPNLSGFPLTLSTRGTRHTHRSHRMAAEASERRPAHHHHHHHHHHYHHHHYHHRTDQYHHHPPTHRHAYLTNAARTPAAFCPPTDIQRRTVCLAHHAMAASYYSHPHRSSTERGCATPT